MSAQTPRPLRAPHRTRLAKALAALALVVVSAASLAACSLPSLSKSSAGSSHACADKVAQEIAYGKTVSGMWNCLSTAFQNNLHAYGLDGDGAFDFSGSQTKSFHYVGHQLDMEIYAMAVDDPSGKTVTGGLILWVDASGHVTNAGIGTQAF